MGRGREVHKQKNWPHLCPHFHGSFHQLRPPPLTQIFAPLAPHNKLIEPSGIHLQLGDAPHAGRDICKLFLFQVEIKCTDRKFQVRG